MKTKLLSWMLICGLALLLAVPTQAATTRSVGRIVAAKVQGVVTALNKADNTRRQLHNNDTLSQGYIVTTGAKSSVVLVFANGASVNLGEDSILGIDEFLMEPFSGKVSASEAKEEPSTSVTKLTVTRGEVVGNVKHLHRETGSSFEVSTPVGAAGIRGTTFRIVFRPDSSGKMSFTLSTSEGVVLLTGINGTQSPVPAGKEVAATFDVAPGTTTIVPGSLQISGVTEMSAETQAVIAKAVSEIVEANAPSAPANPGNPPGAITPASQTTPGDGKG
jgi:hypothetical protein